MRLSELVRQTAALQAGGVAGTLVSAIAGVLLARWLGAESFGQYALAFSVASIATLLFGAGAQDAIAPATARAWAQGDAAALRRTYGFYAKFVGACALATLPVAAVLPFITRWLYADVAVGHMAALIVVASIVSTTVFALTQLSLQVAGRMKTLASLTLTDIIVRYGFMLTLVAAGFGALGAAAGHLAGAAILLVVASAVFGRMVARYPLLPRLRELPNMARVASWNPLAKPSLWVTADRNLAMLYGALPVAMVGYFAAPSEIAYFKLAFGYLMLAMTVLGPVSTVMNIHFPTVQTADNGNLPRTFLRVTAYATLLSSAVTAVVLALAPLVFRLLYGEQYLPAIPYVYGLGVMGALFGIGAGLGAMWRSLGLVRVSIVINLIVLGAGIPAGIWMISAWGLWGAVAMVTAWYTISHIVSFMYLVRALRHGAMSASMERQ